MQEIDLWFKTLPPNVATFMILMAFGSFMGFISGFLNDHGAAVRDLKERVEKLERLRR